MSTFNVPIVRLAKIGKHPNGDNLSITQVKEYPVICKTGEFSPGDLAIYIPVDSVVPLDQPCFDWLKDPNRPGKVTHRVKAKKLRGIFSMGFLVPVSVLGPRDIHEGDNVADLLGITKFIEIEPPSMNTGNESDPGFMPVYDVEHWREHNDVLALGEEVYVTEKIHGSNGRICYKDGRLWVGSHKCVKRQDDRNLWWQIAKQYDLENKLSKYSGYVLYGEVYGNVQDLHYGVPKGQNKFMAFDAYDIANSKFLDYDDFLLICKTLDIPTAPLLYRGPYDPDKIVPLCDGQSTLSGDTIREGWVLKPVKERWDYKTGRVILKLVSENYYLRQNGTEYH